MWKQPATNSVCTLSHIHSSRSRVTLQWRAIVRILNTEGWVFITHNIRQTALAITRNTGNSVITDFLLLQLGTPWCQGFIIAGFLILFHQLTAVTRGLRPPTSGREMAFLLPTLVGIASSRLLTQLWCLRKVRSQLSGWFMCGIIAGGHDNLRHPGQQFLGHEAHMPKGLSMPGSQVAAQPGDIIVSLPQGQTDVRTGQGANSVQAGCLRPLQKCGQLLWQGQPLLLPGVNSPAGVRGGHGKRCKTRHLHLQQV